MHFAENKRFRNRTYQLYVMLESIFGYIVSPMTDSEKLLYQVVLKRITNSIDVFFRDEKLFEVADSNDMRAMHELIKPRVKNMVENIRLGKKIITIRSSSYHVDDNLELEIDESHYNSAMKLIRDTYEIFV